jgi:sulfite exporter TauE/SafE
MTPYLVAFITGLTTGGLSCLAVQGGLLASSFSNQIEEEVRAIGAKSRKTAKAPGRRLAKPILLFLAAKVVAYTLLGFLLGALGSSLQLTATARGMLQLLIGLFMLGNALRMLNVHPIFRYFAIEPPRFLTRYIRRKAKSDDSAFGPLFLGLLTVLIPCGVTQAMMAAALGTSNAMAGGMLMLAFTLGTTPVFFSISYFAMRLGSAMESYFNAFVAVVLLVLGFIAIEAGLNLVGSPISVARLMERYQPPTVLVAASPAAPQGNSGSTGQPESKVPSIFFATPAGAAVSKPGTEIITLKAMNFGYQPNVLHVKSGSPFTLNLVTQNTTSCARAFVIPGLSVEKLLPETGTVSIDIPAQAEGSSMPFSCSMGMYTGTIFFD